MSQLKLYVSGPITGRPNGNREAFDEAEKYLVEQGYAVINPFSLDATVPTDYDKTYWEIIAKDIVVVSEVDGVVFLNGWNSSKGARIEALVALESGKRFFTYIPSSIDKLYGMSAEDVSRELRERLVA